MYFNITSLYNLLSYPEMGMVDYDMSICKVPFNFASHELDNNMQNLGGYVYHDHVHNHVLRRNLGQ